MRRRLRREGVTRTDLLVAGAFVLAALIEAFAVHRHPLGLLVFTASAAPLLTVLAVRRTHPAVACAVIAGAGAVGTAAQAAWWPRAPDGGGVWMFALLLAAYSLGAHAHGRRLALGGLLPLTVVLVADVPTTRGWALVNGVVFVTAFVGVLPTLVGRMVAARRERLDHLDAQREQLATEHLAQSQAAVLAERLRATERLQPSLLSGLRTIADRADDGADPAEIELAARQLLARTREEVVTLSAPVDVPEPVAPAPVDHLRPLRVQAQRWVVLAAGVVCAGLATEAAGTHAVAASTGMAVAGAIAVTLPLAFAWWQPLPAVAALWVAAAGFSRGIAPLDGTLSGAALALVAAFAVAALSSRRAAVVGLVVCWAGQVVGVGVDDPLGVGVIVLACWLGGLAVNESSRLVELGRATTRLMAGQEPLARQRAVVEERMRLARDLHDQIGHSLTVVALQAGAARRLAATDPQRVTEVRAAIAAVAREGVEAMADEPVADLTALLDRTRSAGLDVRVRSAELAAADRLDPFTRGLTQRVVQEALTNVLRHAAGASADVRLQDDGESLTIVVRNTAPTLPAALPTGGRGLAGLRERLATCAGEIRWGACDDGGFSVQAVLPRRPTAQVPA
ncbi:MAG: histidine kinase [Angustibacter sp.]